LHYFPGISGLLSATLIAATTALSLVAMPPAARAQDAPATAPAAPPAAESDDGSLRICNQTANTVSVAFGFRADKGWQSEGWWIAEPSACVTVFTGDLEARRYYYLYATDDIGGGVWDGDVFMCTRDETFTIFGVEDCLARGYERTGFFEIDTQNKSDWTLQLTEGETVTDGPDAGEEAVPLGDETDAGAGEPEAPTDESAQ
jgi:uncharacterized membrane protein